MGRPIDKYFLGATGGSPATVPLRGKVAGSPEFEGYILNQKGSNKFTISNDGGTLSGVCYLVNKLTGLADAECSIVGQVAGGASGVTIQKITAHKAVDYDGNVYSWAVADDSAESLIILTAL